MTKENTYKALSSLKGSYNNFYFFNVSTANDVMQSSGREGINFVIPSHKGAYVRGRGVNNCPKLCEILKELFPRTQKMCLKWVCEMGSMYMQS